MMVEVNDKITLDEFKGWLRGRLEGCENKEEQIILEGVLEEANAVILPAPVYIYQNPALNHLYPTTVYQNPYPSVGSADGVGVTGLPRYPFGETVQKPDLSGG